MRSCRGGILAGHCGGHRPAASLSALAQGGGYLLATIGPLAVGLLHASTGGWDTKLLASEFKEVVPAGHDLLHLPLLSVVTLVLLGRI